MNAERLLQHFERISEAPGAVARLRQFILDLAVRGKLVEQDPADEPAELLLHRIEERRPRAVPAGKRELPPIKDDEIPFRVPASWQWVRLGQVFDYDAGRKVDPAGLPPSAWLLELEDIEKDTGKVTQRLTVEERAPLSTKSSFQQGDVLYGKLRPYLNKVVVADSSGFSTTEIVAIRCYGDSVPAYTCLALRRSDFVDYVSRAGQGTKMPRLRTEDAMAALFPLPPLLEQQRIVDRVDELMALCDELEAAQLEREECRERLITAAVQRLNGGEADSAKDGVPAFEEGALFFLNHLPCLVKQPEHLQRIRRAIISLSVRGKLGPQGPDEEPAPRLGNNSEQERALVARQTGLRPSGSPTPVGVDENPFRVPPSWKWVRVSDVAHSRLGKMLDQAKNKGTPRHYLRVLNVRWFDFNLTDLADMKFEDAELEEFSLRKGDVLICEGGSEPGRAAVWDERNSDIYFQKAIHRVRFSGSVMPTYFVRALYHDAYSGRLAQFFTGVGIKHLTGKGLARYSFPLPPLAEQHRIVAKVDELLALCDDLEGRIVETADCQSQLLEALIHEAIGG